MTKPTQLAGENNRAFRFRALLWVLRQIDKPKSYEEIHSLMRRYYPKLSFSIVTLIRDLKVLDARKEVKKFAPGEGKKKDLRKIVWEAVGDE